jgi:hypothetical protein
MEPLPLMLQKTTQKKNLETLLLPFWTKGSLTSFCGWSELRINDILSFKWLQNDSA